MTLEEYCEFVLVLTEPDDEHDFINIRTPHLADGVPSAAEDGFVFVVLDEGTWITQGAARGEDTIYVKAERFLRPEAFWEYADDDGVTNDVIERDGRPFGPCGNCGRLTSRFCDGEFTYWWGKQLMVDSLDVECGELACPECMWCHHHKELVLNVIEQWGCSPAQTITRLNTRYREVVHGVVT